MVFSGQRWTEGQWIEALDRVPHKSTLAHVPFLQEEFDLIVVKEQWVIFPYSVTKELQGIRLRPLGVKEDRDWQSRCLGDYSYSYLNSETLPIAIMPTMQYGRALERLIKEVVISNPALGPVHILKADVIDVFYRIG